MPTAPKSRHVLPYSSVVDRLKSLKASDLAQGWKELVNLLSACITTVQFQLIKVYVTEVEPKWEECTP